MTISAPAAKFIGRGGADFAYDPAAPLGARNLFWIPSWVGAEVEVDCETGRVVVKHLVVGADSGTTSIPRPAAGRSKVRRSRRSDRAYSKS